MFNLLLWKTLYRDLQNILKKLINNKEDNYVYAITVHSCIDFAFQLKGYLA